MGSDPAVTDAPAREKGFVARHKRVLGSVLFALAMFGVFYYLVPHFVGLGPTLRRLRGGNPWWLGLGVPFEALSIAGYIVLFQGVFSTPEGRIGWGVSYQITMAGGLATKLLAAAGSGGVAVTVWALHASGLSAKTVARQMVCFEVVNYSVYMLAMVIGGLGLWLGLFAGPAPIGLTLVPALLATAVIAFVLSMRWLAEPLQRYLLRRAEHAGERVGTWLRAAAGAPRALHEGLNSAVALVRGRDRKWLGVIPAWGFDIGALWVSFNAFGHSPPGAVLIMGYYVGTLANALPLPGGIGGVEGGMIGAFIGFGVTPSLAVLAVLAYRTLSYWLPLLPEGIGYLQLRHTVGDWRKQTPPSTGASRDPVAGGVSGGA